MIRVFAVSVVRQVTLAPAGWVNEADGMEKPDWVAEAEEVAALDAEVVEADVADDEAAWVVEATCDEAELCAHGLGLNP